LDSGGWLFGRALVWSYYGRGWHLADDGTLSVDPALRPLFGASVSRLTAGNLGSHRIERYAAAANAHYETLTGESATRAWAPLVAAVGQLPQPPEQPVPPVPAAAQTLAALNRTYFPGISPVISFGELSAVQGSRLQVTQSAVDLRANMGFFPTGGTRAMS